jgi:hypothetical protein
MAGAWLPRPGTRRRGFGRSFPRRKPSSITPRKAFRAASRSKGGKKPFLIPRRRRGASRWRSGRITPRIGKTGLNSSVPTPIRRFRTHLSGSPGSRITAQQTTEFLIRAIVGFARSARSPASYLAEAVVLIGHGNGRRGLRRFGARNASN